MNTHGPHWPTLPRQGQRRDKRERAREREREQTRDHTPRHETSQRNQSERAYRPRQPAPETHGTPASPREDNSPHPRDLRRDELRLFGINACLAAFNKRPQDLRKAYIAAARMSELRDVMAHCVKHRLGYRIVEDDDLARLTGSSHHEGVCLEMRRPPEHALAPFLQHLPHDAPACLLWLDGVGNPHNFGALLRSAAHFGIAAVLLPQDSSLALSGAACRVAEGGAEAVPLVRLGNTQEAIEQLHQASFNLAATVPRNGQSLFTTPLPARTVFVLGAEREGMQHDLIQHCDLRLTIPGTGQVESLNIASAVAVLLGAFASRTAIRPTDHEIPG